MAFDDSDLIAQGYKIYLDHPLEPFKSYQKIDESGRRYIHVNTDTGEREVLFYIYDRTSPAPNLSLLDRLVVGIEPLARHDVFTTALGYSAFIPFL